MSELDILFYILSGMAVAFGALVVMASSPIYSSLYLVMSMLSVAGIFMTLNAPFIAGVQIIVYAGAVVVLFVMVLMLFDVGKETKAFTKGRLSGFAKLVSAGLLCGFIAGAAYESVDLIMATNTEIPTNVSEEIAENTAAFSPGTNATKQIATLLFTKYLFAFEILGLLLLVVPIGAVALSRVTGGTHAKH